MKHISFFILLVGFLGFAQTPGLQDILSSTASFQTKQSLAKQLFSQAKAQPLNYVELEPSHRLDKDIIKWKRYENFYKSRITLSGDLPDVGRLQREFDKVTQAKQAKNLANCEWTNITERKQTSNGYVGSGRASAIAFHPYEADTFYVGTAGGGIWKTTDDGLTYTSISDGLPYFSVSAIIVDHTSPTTLYAAISDHVFYGPPALGVYKSTDDGATWAPTGFSIDRAENKRIYSMKMHPTNNQIIMVATAKGLYRSTDGLQTTTQIHSIWTDSIEFDQTDGNIVYNTHKPNGQSHTQVHKSTDAGVTFTAISSFADSGNSAMEFLISNADATTFYASTTARFYKSTDSGATWSSSVAKVGDGLLVVTGPNDELLMSGFLNMYSSTDGGTTWTQRTHYSGAANASISVVHADQRRIGYNPLKPNKVYLCNDGGVYIYDYATNSFADRVSGLIISQYYDIAVAQDDPIFTIGGTQDNGGRIRNTDGSWSASNGGDSCMNLMDPTDRNIFYTTYPGGDIYRTTDGWNTSVAIDNNIVGNVTAEWVQPITLDPNDEQTIFAGFDVVMKSSDRGDNWTAISGQLAGGDGIDYLKVAPTNSDFIYGINVFGGGTGDYFGTSANSQELYKTTDGGITPWTTVNLNFVSRITNLEIDPADENTIYVTLGNYQAGEKVYVSVDAGVTWTNFSGSLPNVPANTIKRYDAIPGAIFVGTDAGVFYRDNTLNDWVIYGDNLPFTAVTDIEFQLASEIIRIGTHGRGIFEANLPNSACEGVNPPDADGDGVCDNRDICPLGDDNVDSNNNGVPDACEEYCEPNHFAQNEHITDVNLGSIANIGSGYSTDGYGDFTNMTTNLELGSNYNLTVLPNFSFDDSNCVVWIDYNQDKEFTEDEIVVDVDGKGNPYAGGFTVPNAAKTGTTRMRVRFLFGPGWVASACSGSGYGGGETEDYSVNINAPAATNYVYENAAWTPANPQGVATIFDTMEVRNGTYDMTADIEIGDVTISNGATLQVKAQEFTVAGDLVNDGTLSTDLNGRLTLASLQGQTVSGNDLSIHQLHINSLKTIELSNNVNVFESLILTNGELDLETQNATLTLKSTEGVSAYVDSVIAGTIKGSITVEQYFPSQRTGRAFRFLSTPVTLEGSLYDNWQEAGSNTPGVGIQITGGAASAGFDVSGSNNPSVFTLVPTYTDPTQAWEAITSTNGSQEITAGTAYRTMVRGDRTIDLFTANQAANNTLLRSKGTLVTGSVSAAKYMNLNANSFSMIGNPYPAQVDMVALLNADLTRDINKTAFYVWEPTGGASGNGRYITYDVATGPVQSGASTNQYLQPYQSFMVQTVEDNESAGLFPRIIFNETMKHASTGLSDTFMAPAMTTSVKINLFKNSELSTGYSRTASLIKLSSTGSNAIDHNDLNTIFSSGEMISSFSNATALAIENRALPVDGELLPLRVENLASTLYTMRIETTLQNSHVELVDNYLNTVTMVPTSGLQDYSFIVDSNAGSYALDRFHLVYRNTTLSIDNSSLAQIEMYPNPVVNDQHLRIKGLNAAAQMVIYDNMGRVAMSKDIEAVNATKINLASGLYFVEISQGTQIQTLKLIVQ
ncbi:MAG: GEVED domain-containing protein [Nonlabens sp.]|uniref:GEVED domain-containing protein n=1 Tax=Nonlabens sp. TaxID=1888209 RepID=UPI003EF61CD6